MSDTRRTKCQLGDERWMAIQSGTLQSKRQTVKDIEGQDTREKKHSNRR